jgi:hypothetical protein
LGHASEGATAEASAILHRTLTILTRAMTVLESRKALSKQHPWEATMGPFKRPRAFDPLDLEIIDRVYEAAWAQLEAREPFRDREKDGERGEALRKRVFTFASSGKVDFDALCDKVLANVPDY